MYETLAYKVDQIKVVLPTEISDLETIQGHDYLTLFTCTPYAVNSHRLLVRGERVEYTPEIAEQAEPSQAPTIHLQPWMWWLIGGAVAGLLALLGVAVNERRRTRRALLLYHSRRGSDDEEESSPPAPRIG